MNDIIAETIEARYHAMAFFRSIALTDWFVVRSHQLLLTVHMMSFVSAFIMACSMLHQYNQIMI